MYLSKSSSRGTSCFGSQTYQNDGLADMEIDSLPLVENTIAPQQRSSISRASVRTSMWRRSDHDLPATAARPSEPLTRLAGTKRRGGAVEPDQPAPTRCGPRRIEKPSTRGTLKSTTTTARRRPCYFTDPSSSLYPRQNVEPEKPRGRAEGMPQKLARTGSHHHRSVATLAQAATAEQQQPEGLRFKDLSNRNGFSTSVSVSSLSTACALPPELRGPVSVPYEKTAVDVVLYNDHTTAKATKEPRALSSSLYSRQNVEPEKPRGRAEGMSQKLARTGSRHHRSTAILAEAAAAEQQPGGQICKDHSNRNGFSNSVSSVSTACAFQPELRGAVSVPYEKTSVDVVLDNDRTTAKAAKEPRAPVRRRPVSSSMAPAELAQNRRRSIETPAIANGHSTMFAEYAHEVLAHLMELERNNRPSASYMSKQHELNSEMRKILINWLTTVAVDFELSSETLSLTVDIIDRFLSRKRVTRESLQLVGVTSIFIASKVEETHACSLKELVGVCAGAYTARQIVRMECAMAHALDFRFRAATAWEFCAQYWRLLGAEPSADEYRRSRMGSGEADRLRIVADRDARGLPGWTETAVELSQYLVDLVQAEYQFLQYRPSEIAISAIVMALHSLYIHYRIPPSAVPRFTPEYILEVSGYDVCYDPRVQTCIAALNGLREYASRRQREFKAGSGDTTYDGLWAKYPGVE